jgi:hypothetical protein
MASSTVCNNFGLFVIETLDAPDRAERWSAGRVSADKLDPLTKLEAVALGIDSSSTVLAMRVRISGFASSSSLLTLVLRPPLERLPLPDARDLLLSFSITFCVIRSLLKLRSALMIGGFNVAPSDDIPRAKLPLRLEVDIMAG